MDGCMARNTVKEEKTILKKRMFSKAPKVSSRHPIGDLR